MIGTVAIISKTQEGPDSKPNLIAEGSKLKAES